MFLIGAVGDGDAAGGEGLAGVGAIDEVGAVFRIKAQADFLRLEV